MKTMKCIALVCLGTLLWACGEKQARQEKVILLEEKIAASQEELKTSGDRKSVV